MYAQLGAERTMEVRLFLRRIGLEFCVLVCLILVVEAATTPGTPQADTCASHPCENGGSCTSYTNAFICRCPDDYIGLRCETHASQQGPTACDSAPCIHGECVSTQPQQFTCMCPKEWRGSTCNIDVDDCVSNPCLNGATCQNSPGEYSCVCPVGFAGRNCEQDNSCTTNICSNNGTCLLQNEQPICICPIGFSGNTCEDGVACATKPCKNGHCVPSDEDPNGYVCNCHAGYTARLCDQLLYAACSHDGEMYYDGESRIDNCNECHCRGGEWRCPKKFCGSVHVKFDFVHDFDLVEGREEKFKSLLRTHLARKFSIEEDMINDLKVSAGSIHVEFELIALLDSHLNVEDVAADMLAKLDSGTFYFRFEETSLFVDTSSVKLEKVEPSNDDPTGSPVIDNVTLVVVCVLVSLLLVVAVVVGTVIIICHRKRSEKTAKGQFGGREKHEESPMNNTNHTRHHNNLYNGVPTDTSSQASNADLKDINIAMFKVADPKDKKFGIDHV